MQVGFVEYIGESHKGWEDAVKNAVDDAVKSYGNVTGVEVYNLTADVHESRIVDYKANLKIAYTPRSENGEFSLDESMERLYLA